MVGIDEGATILPLTPIQPAYALLRPVQGWFHAYDVEVNWKA
jgi:hypothetical protein